MGDTTFKKINSYNLERATTFMGLVGHLATYIQVFKIFYLQSSYAVSFIATVISFVSMIFWLIYGIKEDIIPLIICNIFGLIGFLLIMVGIVIYGNSFL